jgi:hypothetical protein
MRLTKSSVTLAGPVTQPRPETSVGRHWARLDQRGRQESAQRVMVTTSMRTWWSGRDTRYSTRTAQMNSTHAVAIFSGSFRKSR